MWYYVMMLFVIVFCDEGQIRWFIPISMYMLIMKSYSSGFIYLLFISNFVIVKFVIGSKFDWFSHDIFPNVLLDPFWTHFFGTKNTHFLVRVQKFSWWYSLNVKSIRVCALVWKYWFCDFCIILWSVLVYSWCPHRRLANTLVHIHCV